MLAGRMPSLLKCLTCFPRTVLFSADNFSLCISKYSTRMRHKTQAMWLHLNLGKVILLFYTPRGSVRLHARLIILQTRFNSLPRNTDLPRKIPSTTFASLEFYLLRLLSLFPLLIVGQEQYAHLVLASQAFHELLFQQNSGYLCNIVAV